MDYKKYIYKRAFTLVELIVVIVILWILSTIGFMSFIWYSLDSRDGTRLLNITQLESGLEAVKSTKGEYPTPDNSYDIMYEGDVLWTQGTLGDRAKKNLKYTGKYLDPKYQDIDYNYSISGDGEKYQIGTILEQKENS